MPPTPVEVPTLTDGVVTLRELREDDLSAIVEQSRDPETARWTSVPAVYGPQDAAAFLAHTRARAAEGAMTSWAIEHGHAFAGLIHLRREGTSVVEISFAGHPTQRGRGVMTAAARLVCGHAFERGEQLVLWHAMVGNFASRKVAWGCGFTVSEPVWRAAPPRRGGQAERVWAGHLLKGEPMQPRTRWLTAPALEADGIRLRPFRDDDAPRFPEEHDSLTARFSANLPTRDTFAEWLLSLRTRTAEGRALACAMVDPSTDTLLGGLDVSRLDVPLFAGSGILGFWLLPDARGRGVLGRALEVMVPWALRRQEEGGLGLHRLTAGCANDNWGSARALRRAGFAFVGTERQAMQVEGSPRDSLLFDLLATDDREAARVEPGRIPVVETARLRLRPWRADDVPGPGEGPDDASRRFMPEHAHPDAADFRTWFEQRQVFADEDLHLDWCIADRESDHALGNVTIFRLGPPKGRFQAEVGYWLHPPARGRGILPEALTPLIEHAFRPISDGGMGLTRLYAETDLDNAASQAVLLGAGFRKWGQDRQAYRNASGELTDGAYFELLAGDERVDRRTATRPLGTRGG